MNCTVIIIVETILIVGLVCLVLRINKGIKRAQAIVDECLEAIRSENA